MIKIKYKEIDKCIYIIISEQDYLKTAEEVNSIAKLQEYLDILSKSVGYVKLLKRDEPTMEVTCSASEYTNNEEITQEGLEALPIVLCRLCNLNDTHFMNLWNAMFRGNIEEVTSEIENGIAFLNNEQE